MKYFIALLGFVLYFSTITSVVKTLVIPRGHIARIPKVIDIVIELIYKNLCKTTHSYKSRDALRSSQAAVNIFLDLLVWIISLLFALSFMLLPSQTSIGNSIREAGASLLTLGFVTTPGPWATIVDFIAGFSGLVIVALQISYLPTIYAAFNRRETKITLLSSHVGSPPWGPELLARTRIGIVDNQVLGIYKEWEEWAADVAESHSTYPILLRLRSPDPYSSWIISLLCVLDSAALYLSLSPSQAPLETRLALRMGFECLRTLARSSEIEYDNDPKPTDPIQLSFSEFMTGVDRIVSVGFPIERDLQEAWKHFKGWRVNYESIAYTMAEMIDAVPAQWSGSRILTSSEFKTQRVINRTPDDTDGSSSEFTQ